MLEKDIYPKIASELKVQPHQVEAAAKLLDEGNTVPFIARYRKEATGSLEDEQLRVLEERLAYLRGLEPLANRMLLASDQKGSPEAIAAAFCQEDKGVATAVSSCRRLAGSMLSSTAMESS